MFDIGFLELLIIGVVGLLVLGPERLPKAARTAGLWIGRIKRTVSGMQREINAQLEAEELRQKLAEQQKKLDEGFDRVKRNVEDSVDPSSADRATPDRKASEQANDDRQQHGSPERRLDDALGRARRQVDDADSDTHEDAPPR
ncbi:Sec-independent protein translocase protein TatB [Halomonas organivorans]|uniref:Sec-independent protein translocase protein TatB n=1 Tax=Halomonas organivorans TaxID=257772 RepID=A0A7W5G6A7_9GAMM|nr:Sec-independent protein translocase protein TatB [Halomonas organivorans]MBB3141950.1 sec-independent protein translocase protein TatB [Halomonas organivorans]